MTEKTKSTLKTIGWILVGALLPSLAAFIGFSLYLKHPKIEYYEFNISEVKEETEWKYDMLPAEMSDYICSLCEQLDLDSDLVVAIILKENPELNPEAIHRNPNGSLDLGIGQLNSNYLYSVFLPAYWKLEEEFDPFNWKMNVYLMTKHIAYLSKELKVFDDIVCAYNCGAGRTMSGDIPASTRSYLATVKNTYRLLKEAENGRGKSEEN